MSNPIALRLVAIIFLIPSTLVVGWGSLLGLAFASAGLRDAGHAVAAAFLLLAMALGWFGLVTLWRLYYGLLRGRRDINRQFAWAGLASGVVVSLGLIALTGGALAFRIAFFGCPVPAAAYFSILFWRRRSD